MLDGGEAQLVKLGMGLILYIFKIFVLKWGGNGSSPWPDMTSWLPHVFLATKQAHIRVPSEFGRLGSFTYMPF